METYHINKIHDPRIIGDEESEVYSTVCAVGSKQLMEEHYQLLRATSKTTGSRVEYYTAPVEGEAYIGHKVTILPSRPREMHDLARVQLDNYSSWSGLLELHDIIELGLQQEGQDFFLHAYPVLQGWRESLATVEREIASNSAKIHDPAFEKHLEILLDQQECLRKQACTLRGWAGMMERHVPACWVAWLEDALTKTFTCDRCGGEFTETIETLELYRMLQQVEEDPWHRCPLCTAYYYMECDRADYEASHDL